jgi:hypothetical protein
MDKARGLACPCRGLRPVTDPIKSVFMSDLMELEKDLGEPRKKVAELAKRDTRWSKMKNWVRDLLTLNAPFTCFFFLTLG